MSAMPLMLAVLCTMAIAYRYYSAFLAAKVAVLDDTRATPARRLEDGQNYEPTNKWVLFGHHFAAISGAGPLIGPVLAAQFGYLPGLLWIVIGVCLAGAVQDFLVLGASIRRGGRSLAQIAFEDIGPVAGWAASVAILFILVVALAGLGKVVVKALGGEMVPLPGSGVIRLPHGMLEPPKAPDGNLLIPGGSTLIWDKGKSFQRFDEGFELHTTPEPFAAYVPPQPGEMYVWGGDARIVPGSPWGTFTIAATIPIALLIGVYMHRVRKGRVLEASIVGAILVLAATVGGGWIATHGVARWFDLTQSQVLWAMAIYGFVAAILPVWVLLVPRDYLSSFLKIGTIAVLVIGTLVANPKLAAPAVNHVFLGGGPTVPGKIFPFLFITIMCGAISGFHALVSSGTTPKMIARESDGRMIGYGAMLMEGLVGVVALIAAAALPVGDWAAMNTEIAKVPAFHDRFVRVGADVDHLNVYEDYTQESLRGRTGGAVTLAVGMAKIFDDALSRVVRGGSGSVRWLWKYWYHFAIMFEALFILTTIDAGTRIGRFLLQEVMGKVHPKLAEPSYWPAALFATAVIVAGWAYFINAGSFAAIWAMFGVANQMLAVIALAIVSAYLVNEGRAKYLWVTAGPMIFVFCTTSTAACEILASQVNTVRMLLERSPMAGDRRLLMNAVIMGSLLVAMLGCTFIIVGAAARRVVLEPRRDWVGAVAAGG